MNKKSKCDDKKVNVMSNTNVQRVVEDSVAGCDGRIRVNDHIVEVLDIKIQRIS